MQFFVKNAFESFRCLSMNQSKLHLDPCEEKDIG